MRDEVRDALLAMLMDGRLAAGTSVSIDRLSRDLGVSQTPVREALVEIERPGWSTESPIAATRWRHR